MEMVFIVEDISGKQVRLTKERWSHINQQHPEISPYTEEIKEAIRNPQTSYTPEFDDRLRYCYHYLKYLRKHLLVIVKYLNGEGFVITAYLVQHTK